MTTEAKEKKRALEAAIKSLETDIEEYSIAAKKENNLTSLTKANSFRVTVCQKKETLSSFNSLSKEGNIVIFRKHFSEIEWTA